MQTPLIAAITGLGDCSTCSISCSRLGSASAAGVLNSRMSAPPEKTLSVPVMTMIGREAVPQGAVYDDLLLEAEGLIAAAMRPDAPLEGD
jgi:hypothetical protein